MNEVWKKKNTDKEIWRNEILLQLLCAGLIRTARDIPENRCSRTYSVLARSRFSLIGIDWGYNRGKGSVLNGKYGRQASQKG